MKKLRYFLREYKFDILASLVAVVTAILAPRFSIIIIFVSLLIVIYLRIRDRDFYYLPLSHRGERDDWLGSSRFEYERQNQAFVVTQADPGVIYSKCLTWSNYEFSFDFKIVNTCLGVILRAVNLANYVMLQFTLNGVRPHVRINDGWNIWEHQDAKLTYESPLSQDKWYKCKINCDNRRLRISILSHDGKVLFDRVWEIPSGTVLIQYKHSDEHPVSYIPFPMTLDYGSVGFRNSGHEKAFIKNVLVEKL